MASTLNRLNYNFSTSEDEAGLLENYYEPHSLDMGLSTANKLYWNINESEDMTDGSGIYLKLVAKLTKADGSKLGWEDFTPTKESIDRLPVGLCNSAFGNFWSSIGVSLNGFPLPPVTEAPYTSFFVNEMGSGWSHKSNFLNAASGRTRFPEGRSEITHTTYEGIPTASNRIATGETFELYGRLASDFFLTCSQLIPNNVRMEISLTRQSPNFVLQTPFLAKETELRLQLLEATLFVKRVRLNAAAMALVNSSLATRGLLKYQRLDTRVMPVTKSSIFRWPNIWPSSHLPSRIFFGLVHAESYRGDLKRESLFFEAGGVERVRVQVNGREILPEPIVPHLHYAATDGGAGAPKKGAVDMATSQALGPLMAMTRTLDLLDNRDATQGVTQDEWMTGYAIYAVDLPGYGSNRRNSGSVDVIMEFKEAPTKQFVAVAMGEFHELLACSGSDRAFSPAS